MSAPGVGVCEKCGTMLGCENPFAWAYLHSLETGHEVRTLIDKEDRSA